MMAKYEFYLGVGLVGCVRREDYEIPDEDFEDCTEDEKEKIITEYLTEWMWNHVEIDFKEIK